MSQQLEGSTDSTSQWKAILASGEGFTNDQLCAVIERKEELREQAGKLLLQQEPDVSQLKLVAKYVPSLRESAMGQLLQLELPAEVLQYLYENVETYREQICELLKQKNVDVVKLLGMLDRERDTARRSALWEAIQEQFKVTPIAEVTAIRAVKRMLSNITSADSFHSQARQLLLECPADEDDVADLLRFCREHGSDRENATSAIREKLRTNAVTNYLQFTQIFCIPELREAAWEALPSFGKQADVLSHLLCHCPEFDQKDRAWTAMKGMDLSSVDLLEVAEHAPKPYRDEAWTLFEQLHPSVSSFQHILEKGNETYITPRLWQYCFDDKRSMDEMCLAMACMSHNSTDAAQEILRRNPTNRALISIILHAPKVRGEAWGLLKQRGPREEDLILLVESHCHSSVALEAKHLLNAMRSPEKKAFLKGLKE